MRRINPAKSDAIPSSVLEIQKEAYTLKKVANNTGSAFFAGKATQEDRDAAYAKAAQKADEYTTAIKALRR